MKKAILYLFSVIFWVTSLSSVLHSQQQDKFIIGVDWLNPHCPNPSDPNNNFYPLSNNYWDLAKSFGINFGALNIHMGINNNSGTSHIQNELTKAASKDISIFLWPRYIPDQR